ncbi:MAG: hypothetical protein IT176_09060 [Acidobacteria bacterium]|nr:hypothetical protein [Acidobacteriota bacterium]
MLDAALPRHAERAILISSSIRGRFIGRLSVAAAVLACLRDAFDAL